MLGLSIHYFISLFLFLLALSKFHHLFASSCYILYFLIKYLKIFLKKGRMQVNNIRNMIFHLSFTHYSGNFPPTPSVKGTDWRNSNLSAIVQLFLSPLQNTKLRFTWLFCGVLPVARDFKVWIFSKTRLTFLLVASSLSVLLEKRQQKKQGYNHWSQNILSAKTHRQAL